MRIERWLQILPLRLRSLFRRARVEQELDEEILDHLERQTALNVAAGMSPVDARAAARRAFGTIEAHKERVRDTRGVQLFDDLVRDLNYATGTLRRSPGFAATTILTLAIGI
ncbi:MAG: permease prefix domain 1-containing protein, partial [Gemmatimonadaceae bacterium]